MGKKYKKRYKSKRYRKEFEGVVVYLDDCNGNLNTAIKRLNNQLEKEGITEEIYRRMYFEKPSDKKRRKRAEAAYRRSKNKD